MTATCRSDCSRRVERLVVMEGPSGRTRTATVCGLEAHELGLIDRMVALGFEILQVVDLEGALT